MASNRILELASLIAASTPILDAELRSQGFSIPSFDAGCADSPLPEGKASNLRLSLLEATDELHSLLLGPIGILTTPAHNSLLSLQALSRFNVAECFHEGKDEATFQEIAAFSGVEESIVRRLLRHAMTRRIFCEPREGVVAHTSASKVFVENHQLRQWIGMVTEEMWPAASKTVDALMRWPASEEPHHSGYNIAFGTNGSLFDDLGKDSLRQERYADAMSWFAAQPGLDPRHIVDAYDWSKLGRATVVDVGGSQGSVCLAIARKFPLLHCVVQDKPSVVEAGRKNLSLSMEDRIMFAAHDIFEDQPVIGASVYLLRWVLHDWPDSYAVRILRALMPAIRHGGSILICEYILPSPGTLSCYQERGARTFDLAMLGYHNSKERDIEDWKALLRRADVGFELSSVTQPQGSRLAILEVIWSNKAQGEK